MPKRKQSLVKKLCLIMKRVDSVVKRGENATDGYRYATEGDVKEAFRGELSRLKVFLIPKVLETRRVPINLMLRGGDVNTFVTECRVEWTFHDGESRDTLVAVVDGAGEDQSDKGVYKALTGSLKALLMASFLIRSGDDPDTDSKSSAKEVREKKVEDAQGIAKAKLDGTFVEPPPLSLWYTFPYEGHGLEAAVRGSDDALARYKDELSFHGKYLAKYKCYAVPTAKLDDLKFVLKQLKCELREAGDAGSH